MEFDDIGQVLRHQPQVNINKFAKNSAISMALVEFDKNNYKKNQGISYLYRLKVIAILQFIFGEKNMKKNQIIIVGAFCALFVVGLVPRYLDLANQSEIGLIGDIRKQNLDEMKEAAESIKNSGASVINEPIVDSLLKTEKVAGMIGIDSGASAIGQVVNRMEEADNKKDFKNIAPSVSYAAIVPAKISKAKEMYILDERKMYMPMEKDINIIQQEHGRDKFKDVKANSVKLAKDEPVSTFSIDVDTASYGFVRSSLNQNVLPQKNAVRIEELINYFPYDYSSSNNKDEPFKANVSVFPTPWNKETKLMHIGIKGYQLESKPRANLVFLLDTSGSMNEPNKLPLVQNALKMLLDTLDPEDSVSIVTYAGNAGVALPPTKVKDKLKIVSIIDNLGAGGSTAGAEGIRQAYQLAEQNFDAKGVNRVILATDGDFNVGITDTNELKSFVERKRATGVTLSVLGFGRGNYNDEMMQTLAQNGNGNAAYIDNINEARKVLVEESGSTLFTIAKDVKIQVEFNPATVAEYRLIGYETRMLNKEDFNNDKVDAGDIGSGHTVTAIYEITPVDSNAKLIDDLRYKKGEKGYKGDNNEYAFIKIRYKAPEGDVSKLITTPINVDQEYKSLDNVPVESRFAASVAAFGQLLRDDHYLKNYGFDNIINLAEGAKGADKFGYRAEFINLVRLAKNAPALPVLR